MRFRIGLRKTDLAKCDFRRASAGKNGAFARSQRLAQAPFTLQVFLYLLRDEILPEGELMLIIRIAEWRVSLMIPWAGAPLSQALKF
jgi:hypothetical protein